MFKSKPPAMQDHELEALCQNPGIIRNRLKIYGTRQNAQTFLKIQQEFGTFDAYVWSFVKGKDIMLNPHSGVKIYRIDNLPAPKRAWYHTQMKSITNATFIDWLERVRDNKVGNEVLERIKDTPLGTLVRDRNAEKINKLIKNLQTQTNEPSPSIPPHSRL
jgi:hypothetical protein